MVTTPCSKTRVWIRGVTVLMSQLVSSLLRVLRKRHGTPVEEPVAEPRSLRVRFNNDLPSSLGIGYRDIGIDEDYVQWELERNRLKLAARGLEVPPVATMGSEEDKDLEDDLEEDEDPEESEDFVVSEDSLEPVDLKEEDP
ncbi:hypothetical protein FNV43_RR21650 [Rhamnella rubrinervis]|uniref:Uncharacterized protein n=1 Tax=Rhamnella rubrinervis TaxID=2594499 RepID=A0A8K0DVJ3_9ROSA|nr:hypothetical protein FNV43_RR21650 [Rhamnella rubrinervis]